MPSSRHYIIVEGNYVDNMFKNKNVDEALAECDKRYDELFAEDVCMKDMLFYCLA